MDGVADEDLDRIPGVLRGGETVPRKENCLAARKLNFYSVEGVLEKRCFEYIIEKKKEGD